MSNKVEASLASHCGIMAYALIAPPEHQQAKSERSWIVNTRTGGIPLSI